MKGLPRSLAHGEKARARIVKDVIKIEDLALTPTGSTAAVVFETAVIGDFPEGNILLLGAVAYLGFAGPTSADLADDWEGDYSIGTVATIDNDLADAGEADVIASTAIGPATAEVIARTRGVIPNTTGVVDSLILDNTDGSLELNLNVLFDADEVTDSTTVTVTVNGELYLSYIVLGND